MTSSHQFRVVFIQGAGAGAHEEDALLVHSLREHLGNRFSVEFPRMPDEDEPDDERWGSAIVASIAGTTPVVVVGHSIGGYLLVESLVTERIETSIAAICIIAAPFPGGDADWTFPGFDLPSDFAQRLPVGVPVTLYASKDDEVVPFAHRDLYASAIPGAQVRTTMGGHQLGNDLRLVADDIRRVVQGDLADPA